MCKNDIELLQNFNGSEVSLDGGIYENRHQHNVEYLLSLSNDNLLQNHYIECGINRYPNLFGSWEGRPNSKGEELHWGWETPGSTVRGQFLGHWMSAAAREVSNTGHPILKAKLHQIIEALDLCQQEHGGEWVFSIPTLYFDHLGDGKPNGVPQYVVHKTLMGLVDAYRYADEEQALAIALRASRWLQRWSQRWSSNTWDTILDTETGGMLEVWADLFEITHNNMFVQLLDKYWHRHLFDPLLKGEDVLTNKHANTTIPEAIGAARAYEVTGEQRWRDVVERYWECAVDRRGMFATGGYNAGEIWCPPFEYAARRGDKNQELCTVYNMMRLAEIMFRWSGDTRYMDYYELNSINGVLAQTHPETGMPAYYLSLEGGGRKLWGSRTNDFWCCHGSAIQANEMHNVGVYYRTISDADSVLVIARYLDTSLDAMVDNSHVHIQMKTNENDDGDALHNHSIAGELHRPEAIHARIVVEMDRQIFHKIRLRIPEWSQGVLSVTVNGESAKKSVASGFLEIPLQSRHSAIDIWIRRGLHVVRIPDERDTVAFLDGPVVLAGICDGEETLYGDLERPSSILSPSNERQWGTWLQGYRTVSQPTKSVSLLPLYEITDQRYSVYFPIHEIKKD